MMRSLTASSIWHLLLIFAAGLSPVSALAARALVYSGPGACPEDCAQAAAYIAQRAGMQIKLVGPDFDVKLLHEADVWIQPGGDAVAVANAMPAGTKEELRNFIRAGGGYLGFCAGMFFADSTVDDADKIPGLGIIPGSTRDYKTVAKAVIIPINWQGKIRHMYLEEGGFFELDKGANATLLARYPTGEAAAIAARFGKGHVAVSGPHPEAPRSWLEEHGLEDPDGPDYDLADEMLLRALPAPLRDEARAHQLRQNRQKRPNHI
jgi:glutamine amidotransferase-like uncharacterized protein